MRKYVRIALWSLLVVGVVVGGLRATVLEWFVIPEDDAPMALSGAPNLNAGDTTLLWKGAVDVGDLARCVDPDEPRRFVYGRILAKGSEIIEIAGQDIKVDGKSPTQETSCTKPEVTVQTLNGEPATLSCGMEAFRGYRFARLRSSNAPTPYGPRTVTVPPGKLFLVSDNRVFPMDSREYGMVPVENCKATFFFRLWSKKGFSDAENRFSYIR
jgi:signal peptidase I